MRRLFEIFLYLNVGIGSLFFVIWFFTTFSFFPNVSAKGDPSGPATGLADSTPPSAGDGGSPRPAGPATGLADSTPPSAGDGSARPPAGPANAPTPPSAGDDGSARPPASVGPANAPTPPSAGDGGSARPADRPATGLADSTPPSVPSSVQRQGASISGDGTDNNVIPPPPEIPSANTDEMLQENMEQQPQSNQAIDSKTAKDLQNINQKVANIYRLLSDYQYDSVDRRDPFNPYQVEEQKVVEGVMEENVLPDYPTGKYALTDITLVGIKWNSKIGASKALFKTDEGIYQLQKNDRIGRNRGVIYQVREDGVIILEPRVIGTIDKKGKSYTPFFMPIGEQHNLENRGEYVSSSVSSSPPPPASPPPPTSPPSSPSAPLKKSADKNSGP